MQSVNLFDRLLDEHTAHEDVTRGQYPSTTFCRLCVCRAIRHDDLNKKDKAAAHAYWTQFPYEQVEAAAYEYADALEDGEEYIIIHLQRLLTDEARTAPQPLALVSSAAFDGGKQA